MKLLLNLFDMLGFFTESPPNNVFQKLRYISSIFYVGSFKVFNYNLPTVMNFAEGLNSRVQFAGAIFTQTIMFIDAFVHRSDQRKLWAYAQVASGALHIHRWKRILFIFSKLLIIFIVHGLSTTWAYSYTYKAQVLIPMILMRMYHIRIIQYMIAMELVCVNIKHMKWRATEAIVLRGTVKESLKGVRDIHGITLNMVDCLNDIFGYSQFQVVVFCFFVLVTDYNWAYLNFIRQIPSERTSNIVYYVFVALENFSVYRKIH